MRVLWGLIRRASDTTGRVPSELMGPMQPETRDASFGDTIRGVFAQIRDEIWCLPTPEDVRSITRVSPWGSIITALNVLIFYINGALAKAHGGLTVWCVCSVVLALVLYRRSRAAQNIVVTRVSPRTFRRLLLLAFLMSCPWLTLAGLTLMDPAAADRSMTFLVLTGMTAGGILMLHRVMAASAIYCGSILAATVLSALFADGLKAWPLLLYATLFGAMLFVTSSVVAKMTRDRDATLSALQQANAEIRRLALEDELTGLMNRAALMETLEKGSVTGNRYAFFLIDLDRFKNINDSMGHIFGDELLKEIASRLVTATEANDLVARLGGDEFAVVLCRKSDCGPLDIRAERILDAMNEPARIGGHVLYSGCSIGGAKFPEDAGAVPGIMVAADIALHKAKVSGRNRFVAFSDDLAELLREEERIATELRAALAAGEVEVWYQPKIALDTGRAVGAEALVRWSSGGQQMSPEVFLEVATERGFMPELSDHIFERVGRDMVDWMGRGGELLPVSVNIHPVDLKTPERLMRRVEALASQVSGRERILLEITEGCFVGRGSDAAAVLIDTLSEVGFSLSLDDFGTGHAALAHLKRLPVSELKIDRSFVAGLGVSRHDSAIVAAMVELAKGLDLRIVAEGVETEAQRRALLELGVQVGQGYLWSQAIPSDRFYDLCLARGAAVVGRR